MQPNKLIWAQIAYKSNKLPHNDHSQNLAKTHKSHIFEHTPQANLAMRDEGAKLLTFVNTWIDGVPSNLDKSLAKWRMSFEQEEEQGRKQRNESPFDRLGTKHYI